MNRRLKDKFAKNELLIMNAAADWYETGAVKEDYRKALNENGEMLELGSCLLRICERSDGNNDRALTIPFDKGAAYLWQKVLTNYKKQGKTIEELRETFRFVYALFYMTEEGGE